MKKLISLLLVLLCNSAYAESGVYLQCNNVVCKSFATTISGKKILIFSDKKDAAFSLPKIKNYGYNLSSITYHAAQFDDTTFFVDLSTGKKSTGFYDVMAIQPQDKIVAYAGDPKPEIILSNIFEPTKRIEIKRNFSPVATMVTAASVKFMGKSKLKLNYAEGSKFTNKTETVPIDYKKLGID